MNITTERLREIAALGNGPAPYKNQAAEVKALAQYALAVQALPDKWLDDLQGEMCGEFCIGVKKCIDELNAKMEKQND